MLSKLGKFKRVARRRFSRIQLLGRWLGFDVRVPDSHQPGLIILQVDGLSRKQFEAAMANGRLPFLRRMVRRGYFQRTSFYSGMPSCTPAVQAEVMYGIQAAVPAFQFLHRRSGKVFRMYEPEAARAIVADVLSDGEPLLKGGASYSNIYSGGSQDARFCAETGDISSTFAGVNPLRLLMLIVMYSFTILRIFGLACLEILVACGDMLRGLLTRRDWRSEIRFVPARVAVAILLREWVRLAVKLAIARGTPVVYANFLGYDEQAHRRGPGSAFAHWGLKGIDGVIKDIFNSARHSDARDYEVVVFSDHGQEPTHIYEFEYGQTIQQAVENTLTVGPLAHRIVRHVDTAIQRGSYMDQRMRQMLRVRRGRHSDVKISAEELAEHVIVTAMGPLGHVYFPVAVSDSVKSEYAAGLVLQQQVPLVMYRVQEGTIYARNARGLWILPDDYQVVCGPQHGFAKEVRDDLIALFDNPDMGDLVLSGWDLERPSVSFVQENGAHGSLGAQETRGFALLPVALDVQRRSSESGESYLRGIDLHAAALNFLRGHRSTRQRPKPIAATSGGDSPDRRLRVATYNVHHCIGVDGKCRPQRTAAVIADLDADVIALQEMDCHRERTGFQDQTSALAAELGMYHRFFPVWQRGEERYGLALLSRFPMTVVREAALTEEHPPSRREARGAMWVTLQTDEGPVHVLNTHLGLRAADRTRQIDELLGERWLAGIEAHEPVILCGDFNAGPRSEVMQRLLRLFRCAQVEASDHQPQPTFASILPLRRIDYVLLSRHFSVHKVCVPKNHATAVASDHLPLCAEILSHRDPGEVLQRRIEHSETGRQPVRPGNSGHVISSGGIGEGTV